MKSAVPRRRRAALAILAAGLLELRNINNA